MPTKQRNARFRVGQVVVWKSDETYMMKIATIYPKTLQTTWQFQYEMATPGFSGKWNEADLRPLTRRERGA